MNEWKRFAKVPAFLPGLRSVVPFDANIAATSKLSPENRGKAVGQKNADGTWSGQRDWTNDRMTLVAAKRAHRDGASIGMQGLVFPGVDLDINDPRLADLVKKHAFEILGPAPVRGRAGSNRVLLMYQIEDGEIPFSKRRVECGSDAIELLGAKQMYLVSGIHKSGVPYEWDKHPCDLGPRGITRITTQKVDKFFATLPGLLETFGYQITGHATGAASARRSIDDPAQWAPSPQHVLNLMKVWKNTPENIPTHDEFVTAIAAIKTSFGPDREDYFPDVLEWALEYPGNDEAYVRGRWESIR